MPDSVSKECYDCCEKFTTFRRRHHCRVCGQIFCSKCCYQEIPGKIMGCSGEIVIIYCRGLQPFFAAGHVLFFKNFASRFCSKNLYFIQKFNFIVTIFMIKF